MYKKGLIFALIILVTYIILFLIYDKLFVELYVNMRNPYSCYTAMPTVGPRDECERILLYPSQSAQLIVKILNAILSVFIAMFVTKKVSKYIK